MTSSNLSQHPKLPSGTVYGVLLNDRSTIERLSAAFNEPPYRAPPVAPVLYIKSRNTVVPAGTSVPVPPEPGQVRIDATVGAVIGKRATRLSPADAMQYVRSLVIVSDLTLPHENYYRPAVRLRCRDAFCPMSQEMSFGGFDLAQSEISILINGKRVHTRSLATLVRSLPQLLSDVTEFITLEIGDVLLVGPPEGAPNAGPGDTVEIKVEGLGTLQHGLSAETFKEAA
jgi:5-oxopent-3-ene-1,2,5-tricarboxylate decarboxylase/2-hydroxyhepta-2,4-diene-1,7-dioate isomerase